MEEYNERPVYKVYAKANINGQVEKFFSTCFEKPEAADILVKEGAGDEYVHVGYYEVLDADGCHNYKLEDGGIAETTDEEKAAEKAAFPVAVSEIEILTAKIDFLEECIVELSALVL